MNRLEPSGQQLAKAVQEEEVKLWGYNLWNRQVLSRAWSERENVMDERSSKSKRKSDWTRWSNRWL